MEFDAELGKESLCILSCKCLVTRLIETLQETAAKRAWFGRCARK